jgi:lysyl-tRNA synthetase class 2
VTIYLVPENKFAVLKARAWMNQTIRAFFRERGVLEVETPYLSQAANTDPHIESAVVTLNGETRYLHTSPEYPMKRLLAAGSGDIFQICKVWRAEELGRRHNPEFTMLEWYRVGFSYQQLMDEVEALFLHLLPMLEKPVRRVTYAEAFLETLGVNPHIIADADLQALVNEQLDVVGELDRQAMLDVLMTHKVEAGFADDALTIVYDYPATQSALAKVRDDGSWQVAERFELYLGSLELGNGYQELTDYSQNQAVLDRERAERAAKNQRVLPKDERFLAAMQAGMPSSSGIAIGLDRVLMAMMGKKNLEEVISFPWRVA